MKKLLLAGAAFASLMAGSAFAADLPRRVAPVAPAPIAVPVFTWTGFYAGVNAGYGFGSDERVRVIGGGVVRRNDDEGGFIGGGQIGYNMQFGMFVAGIEADLQYADLGDRTRFRFGNATFATRDADDYFGTVRGRAGVAFDRFLVYATGGLAYGDVGPFGTDGTGWTLGGGVEYAVTNNISVKVEGLYVNLDRDRTTYRAAGRTFRVTGEEEFGVVRAGLNYKF